MIRLLSSSFVPVNTSNEKYLNRGVPPEEAALLRGIIDEAGRKNLGSSDVHVYLIGPDGHTQNSMGVVRACQNDNLKKMLEQTARDLKVTPGPPIVKPRPQSRPPAGAPPGSLFLHVTAKGANQGDWRQFPAESWIVLTPAESQKLLAGSSAASWDLDPVIVRKIFTTFYPQTEDPNGADRNDFGKYWLKAKVIGTAAGQTTARLDGHLEMGRSFYPGRKNVMPIVAEIVGFVKFPEDRKRIDSIELVTTKATFGEEDFDAGLRSNYEAPAP